MTPISGNIRFLQIVAGIHISQVFLGRQTTVGNCGGKLNRKHGFLRLSMLRRFPQEIGAMLLYSII